MFAWSAEARQLLRRLFRGLMDQGGSWTSRFSILGVTDWELAQARRIACQIYQPRKCQSFVRSIDPSIQASSYLKSGALSRIDPQLPASLGQTTKTAHFPTQKPRSARQKPPNKASIGGLLRQVWKRELGASPTARVLAAQDPLLLCSKIIPFTHRMGRRASRPFCIIFLPSSRESAFGQRLISSLSSPYQILLPTMNPPDCRLFLVSVSCYSSMRSRLP
jgi:hypothetical protein